MKITASTTEDEVSTDYQIKICLDSAKQELDGNDPLLNTMGHVADLLLGNEALLLATALDHYNGQVKSEADMRTGRWLQSMLMANVNPHILCSREHGKKSGTLLHRRGGGLRMAVHGALAQLVYAHFSAAMMILFASSRRQIKAKCKTQCLLQACIKCFMMNPRPCLDRNTKVCMFLNTFHWSPWSVH